MATRSLQSETFYKGTWFSRTVLAVAVGILSCYAPSTFAAVSANDPSGDAAGELIPSLAGNRTIASAKSTPALKRDLLKRLNTMKSKCDEDLAATDLQVKKLLIQTATIHLNLSGLDVDHRRLEQITTQIDALTDKRSQIYAQRDIYDRMIFAVDTKWTSQPLANFFETEFLEMATTELSQDSASTTHLWKTLLYLSVAVREIPEPNEDVVSVVEGYLNFAGAAEPKSPAEYLVNRSYTNGKESVAARSSLLDDGTKKSAPHPGYEASVKDIPATGTLSGATSAPQPKSGTTQAPTGTSGK